MSVNTSLDTLITHFTRTANPHILDAGRAGLTMDWETFGGIVAKVQSLEITVSISNLISTTSSALDAFVEKVTEKLPDVTYLLKSLVGIYSLAVGIGALIDVGAVAGAVSAFIGISIGGWVVGIVAIFLILYGLYLLVPTLGQRVMERVKEKNEEIVEQLKELGIFER